MDRQLRYWRHSEPNPERHYWHFLIINNPREIALIKNKLNQELAPVVEEYVPGLPGRPAHSGLIHSSEGLHYDLFGVVSTVPEIDFSKVYQGKVRRDRRLAPRKLEEGWDVFVSRVSLGEI